MFPVSPDRKAGMERGENMKMNFYGCNNAFVSGDQTRRNGNLPLYFADDYVLFDCRNTCFGCNDQINYPMRTLVGKVNVVILLEYTGCSPKEIRDHIEWGATIILKKTAQDVIHGDWKGRVYDDDIVIPEKFADLLALTEPIQNVPA